MLLDLLHARGFDETRYINGEDGRPRIVVGCSQCEACVINGLPSHETGCANGKRRFEARDCDGDGDGV